MRDVCEIATQEFWVRQRQGRGVRHDAVHPEHVEIERARTPALATFSSLGRLDAQQLVEQRLGAERGREEHGRVQVPRLGRSHGLTLVDRRSSVRGAQEAKRARAGPEMREPVSEVSTQTYDGAMHAAGSF